MPQPDIHESVLDEIQLRRESLQSGAPALPDGGAMTQEQIDGELAVLDADERLLRDHWTTGGVVGAGEPPTAKACGNPQPCPHTLNLAEKYGLA